MRIGSDYETIMFNGELYSMDAIFDTDLYAYNSVAIIYGRKLPDDASELLKTFHFGDRIGKVYSYVKRGTQIWWWIDGANGSGFWIKHDASSFSVDALTQQGVLSEEEIIKRKAEAEKSIPDKILGIAEKILTFGVIGLIAVSLLKQKKEYVK